MILLLFIWKSRINKALFFGSLALSILLWIAFKALYPSPMLVLDSYYYVKAAILARSVNAWPIGYSLFLRLFNLFSHSGNALMLLQFMLLRTALLAFYFTWLFFCRPGKGLSIFVLAVLLLNPLLIYCSNFILSDALFIALSLAWLTQLVWIFFCPNHWLMITHAVTLLFAFTVRYNALYYPILSSMVFFLGRQPWRMKLAGAALPVLLIWLFVAYTQRQTQQITGERQFSPFAGWKTANDALYMYAHVYKDDNGTIPPRFRIIDSMTRHYFVTYKDSGDLLVQDYTSGSFFMFARESPLVQYMFEAYGDKWHWPFLGEKEWIRVAPFYQSYGNFLIARHPWAFVRWFLWPNLLRYISPPGEIFESKMPFVLVDNYGASYVTQSLGLKEVSFSASAIDLSIKVSLLWTRITTMIHAAFVIGFLGLAFMWKRRARNASFSFIVLVATLWVVDFLFSIVSAGVVLRYELFIQVLEIVTAPLLLRWIYFQLDSRSASAAVATAGNS